MPSVSSCGRTCATTWKRLLVKFQIRSQLSHSSDIAANKEKIVDIDTENFSQSLTQSNELNERGEFLLGTRLL